MAAIGEMTLEDAARDAAGNWKRFLGLIKKRAPVSIIWGAPPLASFFLSSCSRIAQELSCSFPCTALAGQVRPRD